MNQLPLAAPGAEEQFQRVEVRRSTRRKKTISAEIVGEALIISIPERMSRAEEQEWVARMSQRMSERKRKERLNDEGALRNGRASWRAVTWTASASRRSRGSRPRGRRWGSCSPDDGTIRLSLTLADYPVWVRDYVIVHELAHLLVPDHSERFWALVERYPLTERARGFLIAKGIEEG